MTSCPGQQLGGTENSKRKLQHNGKHHSVPGDGSLIAAGLLPFFWGFSLFLKLLSLNVDTLVTLTSLTALRWSLMAL